MPITKKTTLPLDLAGYEVYIDERSESSTYFEISKVPTVFTGGKNSFLIGGSIFLQEGSEILIEILDAALKPIYQTVVPTYTQGNSKMISVEVYDTTETGMATIIIMGKAVATKDFQPIPEEWKDVYNVRWIKQVVLDYNLNNTSQLVFQQSPEVFVQENRFLNLLSSSLVTYSASISASLTPSWFSGVQSGYLINLLAPATLSANYIEPKITGSVTVNNITKIIDLPITSVLNQSTAFSAGNYIYSPVHNGIISKFNLRNGNYTTDIQNKNYPVTTSALLHYSLITTSSTNVPISYANIKISNLNTVSGELYKLRVYYRVATSNSNYKLIGDVVVNTEEIFTTSSIAGFLPIGVVSKTPNVENNWYAGQLTKNTGLRPILYPISGTLAYYTPTNTSNTFTVSASNNILLDGINANIPTTASVPFNILPSMLTSSIFTTQVSSSGYYIGTKNYFEVFPTSEYTLTLNAYYKKTYQSASLGGLIPKVDIYIIGDSTSRVVTDNPLGQKIGELVVYGDSQWFENKQFNFRPQIAAKGNIGLRLVVSNGFWYFSNISLKAATDPQFSPSEVRILIPNTDFYNELLEYKIEFFDINSNSAVVSAISVPTLFTGSVIDLGTIP